MVHIPTEFMPCLLSEEWKENHFNMPGLSREA